MNYSRQREAILTVLKDTTSHPSAAWIYDRVRIQIPNISLGTVYRNLAALEKEGMIVKVPVGDAREHFDGDTTPHSHFYCKSCEAISDIPFDPSDTLKQAEENHGFEVHSVTYTFTGICQNCLKDKV